MPDQPEIATSILDLPLDEDPPEDGDDSDPEGKLPPKAGS